MISVSLNSEMSVEGIHREITALLQAMNVEFIGLYCKKDGTILGPSGSVGDSKTMTTLLDVFTDLTNGAIERYTEKAAAIMRQSEIDKNILIGKRKKRLQKHKDKLKAIKAGINAPYCKDSNDIVEALFSQEDDMAFDKAAEIAKEELDSKRSQTIEA